jgi:hypothetical protein
LRTAADAAQSAAMRSMTKVLLLWLGLGPLVALAEPQEDVRAAVVALDKTSYAWETTVRQRFSGETTEPKVDLNAAIEVQGKTDPSSFTEITLLPSRQGLAVPATAVSRTGDVVGSTPIGWMRRTEMRSTPGPDRTVEVDGKQVRLSKAFTVGLRVTAMRRLTEDLYDLLEDVKSYREESGLILAELKDKAVEKLWGEARAKSAPEIQGTVIFKLSEQGVTEYHTVIAIGFPNSRTKKIAWSMQQWTTRVKGIGSTTVEPAADAVKRLEE